MYIQRIESIRKLAHNIDVNINLFEGFSPKKIEYYKGEICFWRYIVNIYGLFADCDRVQIKNNKQCLMELMQRYSLITKDDLRFVSQFWSDVSELRKWFCHNNDENRYYVQIGKSKLEQYLKKALLIKSDKVDSLEKVQNNWDILVGDIDRRFQEYLLILERGLAAWDKSEYKDDLSVEWVELLSRSLFLDKELIRNVIAEIVKYKRVDLGLKTNVSVCVNLVWEQLESKGYSAEIIKSVIQTNSNKIRSNKEIVYESLRSIHLDLF